MPVFFMNRECTRINANIGLPGYHERNYSQLGQLVHGVYATAI